MENKIVVRNGNDSKPLFRLVREKMSKTTAITASATRSRSRQACGVRNESLGYGECPDCIVGRWSVRGVYSTITLSVLIHHLLS